MSYLNDERGGEVGGGVEVGQWAAWVVIFLSIVTIVSLPVIFEKRVAAAAVKASREKPDVQMLVSARYGVAVERALPLRSAKMKTAVPRLLSSLDKVATTSSDKLRVAMVRGELEGKDAALKTLAALEANDPSIQGDVEVLRDIYEGSGAAVGSPRWNDFHDRHGWFADLAASFGRVDSDPLRAAMLQAALRSMVIVILMVLLSFGSAMVGLVLLIIGIVLWTQGKWRFEFGVSRRLPTDRRAYIEAFAVYLGGALLLGVVIRYILQLGGSWGLAALPLAFGVATIWPKLRGQSWSEWRAMVGLHTGKGVMQELFCGAVGYVAGLPVMATGMLATFFLAKWGGVHPTHPIMREISANPWTVAWLLLMASVWAPITEELMFRGAMFGHLRGRLGWWPSALIVAFVFAAIHPQGWAAIPALGSIAMVLAGVREWRGSILGCMMAHAINNTVLIVALVVAVS